MLMNKVMQFVTFLSPIWRSLNLWKGHGFTNFQECVYSQTTDSLRTSPGNQKKNLSSHRSEKHKWQKSHKSDFWVGWQSKVFFHVFFFIWMFPKIRVFPPKSSISIGFFHCFHHPFWGTSIFGNTHMAKQLTSQTKKNVVCVCLTTVFGCPSASACLVWIRIADKTWIFKASMLRICL